MTLSDQEALPHLKSGLLIPVTAAESTAAPPADDKAGSKAGKGK